MINILYNWVVYHMPNSYEIGSDRVDCGIANWWTYHLTVEEANDVYENGLILTPGILGGPVKH